MSRVLLVDDEPRVVEGLKAALRGHPYEVFTATSGAECLGILECHRVEVILCDEQMPGMSGSQLFALVSKRYPETTRIILTGKANLDAAIRAINDGAIYRFLRKPIKTTQLLEVVCDAVRESERKYASAVLVRVACEQAGRLQADHNGHELGCVPVRRASSNASAAHGRELLTMLAQSERESISPREEDVLELIVSGSRVAQVAKALFISQHTVRNHLKSLFQKLDVHSQSELRGKFGR